MADGGTPFRLDGIPSPSGMDGYLSSGLDGGNPSPSGCMGVSLSPSEDREADRAPGTRLVVCLLRSRGRTFLFRSIFIIYSRASKYLAAVC